MHIPPPLWEFLVLELFERESVVFPASLCTGKRRRPQKCGQDPRTNHLPAAQKPLDFRICGACKQKGHVLADCKRKVDKYGFLCGCPGCNTTRHNFDDCVGLPGGKKKKAPKPSDYWHFLAIKRLCKAPLRPRAV
jgi:hypothetical protein